MVARNNLPVELSGSYEPQMQVGPPRALFARTGPTGRVDLTRAGNTVTAATRGVSAFTLLLSPDQFDFAKPVKVVANGRTVFDGKVQKELRTLLKYAAVDNDRTDALRRGAPHQPGSLAVTDVLPQRTRSSPEKVRLLLCNLCELRG
jgi:hypothetical protein